MPGTVVDVNSSPKIPEIPERLTDPRPVLAIGTAIWLIATVVVAISGDRWHDALPICITGLIVGALGTAVFWLQRRASRRGSKSAQKGLR